MQGLPKLPGLDFENRLKQKHHVPHSFDFKNGYQFLKAPDCSIGGDPLKENSISHVTQTNDPIMFDPILTYGKIKQPEVDPFRPHFVRYDKKTLKFSAFFKQQIPESQIEHFRTRFVNIYYFLEDDTITVHEPVIDNCGFPQGKLVRRGKVVKNCMGQYYTWKDFNLGIDMEMQGIVFHVVNCDPFTREFLISNGIEVNPVECMPIDNVNTDRMIQKLRFPKTRQTPVVDDKLRRYLEYQGMVLHFDCVIDNTDQPGGELMTYKLFYYLEDDTIAIKELKENREGRYPFSMFVKRMKLPKCVKARSDTYPAVTLERTDQDIREYYSPADLHIGETLFIYGRKFLLLNCDTFTRDYYQKVLKNPQPNRLEIIPNEPRKPIVKLPDYLGLGSPEDSMACVKKLIPKSPKKDIINYLINSNKFLRYGCIIDTVFPEDQDRRFILMYSLADHMIQVIERSINNSGIQGGRFLSPIKLWKPECNPNDPEYYTAKDLYIGAMVHVFSHRFKITSADLYVYRYMQNYPEQFTADAIETVRQYLLLQGHLKHELSDAIERELVDQKVTDRIRDEPRDMEDYLGRLKVTDEPQNLPPGEKIEEALRQPAPKDDRDICPYYVIPEGAKREGYHETQATAYLEDPNQKKVQFNGDVLTQN